MSFFRTSNSRGLVMITLAAFASAPWLGGCESSKSAPPPAVPEVATISVKPEQAVLTTDLPGRTSAYTMAEIRPQVGGIVQKRLFEEGADIKAGQVLYEIDPAPLQAAYDNATANLAVARRAVERARAALEASRTGVVRQKAILENARTNRKRYEDLLAEGAVAASQRDQAATDADVADATLRSAEAQVESDREGVAAAEAAVQQAGAALETARINLAYARVTAPIAGRIGRSNVTVGALVTAGQPTALATIQQLDPIYVDVTQSSANLLQLKRNIAAGWMQGGGPDRARVKLFLEDGTAYPTEGTLKFSDVTVEPSTGSFVLRVLVSNPHGMLLPGMFIRAQILEGVVEAAILVPQQAVSRDPKGNPLVLLVNAQGKVEQRSIATNRALGDRWLVASGLAAGDRVIVEGIQKVRPGASVKAVAFETPQKASPTGAKGDQSSSGAK